MDSPNLSFSSLSTLDVKDNHYGEYRVRSISSSDASENRGVRAGSRWFEHRDSCASHRARPDRAVGTLTKTDVEYPPLEAHLPSSTSFDSPDLNRACPRRPCLKTRSAFHLKWCCYARRPPLQNPPHRNRRVSSALHSPFNMGAFSVEPKSACRTCSLGILLFNPDRGKSPGCQRPVSGP